MKYSLLKILAIISVVSLFIRNFLLYKKGKNCLLISHEATLSGAPVVLLHLAQVLQTQGWNPIVAFPHKGPLLKILHQFNIETLYCNWRFFAECMAFFSKYCRFCVINTAVNGYIVELIQSSGKPIIWWIHESKAVYSEACIRQLPETIAKNTKIYAGGEYAREQLLKFRPNYNVEILLYPTKDLIGRENQKINFTKQHSKISFYCVGTFEKRKGQDLLAKAIRLLSKDQLKQCRFVFIGKPQDKEIYNDLCSMHQKFHEIDLQIRKTIPLDELYLEYSQMDVLVCPSRDDPMPVVVTDALSLGKIVICSTATGSASIIRRNESGLLFESENITDLAYKLSAAIDLCKSGQSLSLSKKARAA